ncbi:hypothetical protein ACFLVC_01980 [Chloroflexota bacterium]
MEDLAKFVEAINESADHYDMKEFQSIRKQIKSHAHGRRIFPIKFKH